MPEVVVVSTPGSSIYVRNGVVYVKPRDGDPVPVTHEVELVVLAAGAVRVSGRALRRLAELGVRLLVLGHRGHVAAELRPVDRGSRTTETRIAQLMAKIEGWGLTIAAEMTRAKILNQARILRYLAKSRRETWLRDAAYRVEEHAHRLQQQPSPTPEAIRGAEAAAAHRYWQSLAALLPESLSFQGRDPLAADPVNMALNYAYAILYSEASDALILAGLDPYAGFLHTDRSGKQSLTYDYSDTYKPLIDRALLTPLDEKPFQQQHQALTYQARREIATRVLRALHTPLRDTEGQRRELREHIQAYAWRLAKTLRTRQQYHAFTLGTY